MAGAVVVVDVLAVVELVVVPVGVAVVLVVAGAAGVVTLAPLSPALVTKKVTARIRTPIAAKIAGRGRSIRVAVGTIRSNAAGSYCVFGT